MLSLGADLIVFTTQPYEGQGPDWHYLIPCSGQHVFFYSERALAQVGEKFGYRLRKTQAFLVFARNGGAFADAGLHPVEIPAAATSALISKTCWNSPSTNRDAEQVMEQFVARLRAGQRDA